ncbi:MAG: phosphoethanolamine transferase [Xanthomonadales bacterium]|nr:phosphoethanolamine transferase [Xanthomonadales bacterium]
MSQPTAPSRLPRVLLSQEALALLLSVYFLLTAQQAFWQTVLGGDVFADAQRWSTSAALAVIIVAAHALLFGLLFNRWTVKPVAIVLLLTAAAAGYFMSRYRVFLDDDMLRNILHTDTKEAGELVTGGLVMHVALFGALPALLVWMWPLRRRPWRSALLYRSGFLLWCVALIVVGYLSQPQGVAAFARNHKPLRELVAPGNYLVSLWRVARSDLGGRSAAPIEIGLDARRETKPPDDRRPRLLVLVLGETVRAQNWGLNGYHRQTTPELARRDVLNFPDVSACGTSTEISLPCMFSPAGEAGYDRERLRRSESLLHVLHRAGVSVLWRDNQTGCKGTCDGLPFESFERGWPSPSCDDAGCLDQAMSEDLDALLAAHPGDFVLVLHMLGNHGPAYYKRYPDAFERWTPACREEDLARCSDESIRNAYDNAILYGDHWIASLIDRLRLHQAHDVVLWYLSDHGESLGEGGLYLHGVPKSIAPDTQRKVPMTIWLGDGLVADEPTVEHCLAQRRLQPASHDQLFHSVLGLFGVQTSVYQPKRDLFAPCAVDATTAVAAQED